MTMNAVVYMYILISVTTISTKRCKGRVRSGSSCRPRCNYSTGKWQRKFCAAAFIPPPDYPPCLTITGKECRLPFEYEGELVRTCTLKNSESMKPWCVTGTFAPSYWFCYNFFLVYPLIVITTLAPAIS